MKADFDTLDIYWECSRKGTPKRLASWDELYRMTDMAASDTDKCDNPRLLNAKTKEEWQKHTFSCIDIDRPDDGYVEKIMQSDVMKSFPNIIFIQKSYHGKLHIVYQIPETSDWEIAQYFICRYINEFMEWCDDKGIKFTAADKQKIRSAYPNAEKEYDEGDIDLKFASNRCQPVYINSNEIIVNNNYMEWLPERFKPVCVNDLKTYFSFILTKTGIEMCNENQAGYPFYSFDGDNIFSEISKDLAKSLKDIDLYSKKYLSQNESNLLTDSELDSENGLSLYDYFKAVIKEVKSAAKSYYLKSFSTSSLDSENGLSLYEAGFEARKYKSTTIFDRYSNDFQEVSKHIPYCCDTLTLDFQYDGYETMLDNCISVIRNANISYQAKKDEKKLFKPDCDISSGQRFNTLPEFYFTDGDKITGKDVKKYLKQAIKSACLNAAASINLKRGEITDDVLHNYEEYCCPGMVVATVLYWIDNTCDESIDYKTLIEYFSTVKKEFDKINVGVLANKYKSKHGKLETKEDRLIYGREVVLPKKYAAVEKTVIKVIDEAYPSTNDFDVKDIVELLNNYNGVGVQKKRDGKWTAESVNCLFKKKFGGLKKFKLDRLKKL